jgi:hypothetical protein
MRVQPAREYASPVLVFAKGFLRELACSVRFAGVHRWLILSIDKGYSVLLLSAELPEKACLILFRSITCVSLRSLYEAGTVFTHDLTSWGQLIAQRKADRHEEEGMQVACDVKTRERSAGLRRTYSLEEAWKRSQVGAARFVINGWYYEVEFNKQKRQGEWTVRPGPTLARSLGTDAISWQEPFTSLEKCKQLTEKHEVHVEQPVKCDTGWMPLDVLHFKSYDL